MKYITKELVRICLMIVIVAAVPYIGISQPSGDPLQNPDANVPIDGGLTLALAAGAGYLVKRRHDAKKKKAEQDKEILP
ncbi:MAG TPA: hypothetical protein VF622_15390 [Segetibacter sp.]|jgi:hypothetical protein